MATRSMIGAMGAGVRFGSDRSITAPVGRSDARNHAANVTKPERATRYDVWRSAKQAINAVCHGSDRGDRDRSGFDSVGRGSSDGLVRSQSDLMFGGFPNHV
jgi:hypothetical protein